MTDTANTSTTNAATNTTNANTTSPAASGAAPESRYAQTLNQYYAEWERKTRAMTEATAGVDWSGVDWSKLRPQDIGVRFGPPMTAEQFAEYKRRKHGRVDVVKAEDLAKK